MFQGKKVSQHVSQKIAQEVGEPSRSSISYTQLVEVVDFVFAIARKSEKEYEDFSHCCQDCSIVLESVLRHFDTRAEMVLLDFELDYQAATSRYSPNMVHYVVSVGDSFADASPNLYMHKDLGI